VFGVLSGNCVVVVVASSCCSTCCSWVHVVNNGHYDGLTHLFYAAGTYVYHHHCSCSCCSIFCCSGSTCCCSWVHVVNNGSYDGLTHLFCAAGTHDDHRYYDHTDQTEIPGTGLYVFCLFVCVCLSLWVCLSLCVFAWVRHYVGKSGSRRSSCSAVRRQLSDTVSRLFEVLVEVSVTAVDWLANFSDYGVMTKLRDSYEVVKSASKIWILRFCDSFTTF